MTIPVPKQTIYLFAIYLFCTIAGLNLGAYAPLRCGCLALVKKNTSNKGSAAKLQEIRCLITLKINWLSQAVTNMDVLPGILRDKTMGDSIKVPKVF